MSAPAFRLQDVTYRHPGGVLAVSGVSFTVASGEAVALLGANGCGKSTLLKLLDGLVFPASGSIEAFGGAITREALSDVGTARDFRRRVALLFQDPDVQLFSATVAEEIAFGPLQLGLPPAEVSDRVREAMDFIGVAALADRAPNTLSGGQKKKVALASLLVVDPGVLLLDEPFAGLDPRSQVWLIELLQLLRSRGKTIIATTHDLSSVEDIAERAIVLSEQHQVAADAPAARVLADQALLLSVNLIHEHAHRHGRLVHAHPHGHGHEHGHGEGDGSRRGDEPGHAHAHGSGDAHGHGHSHDHGQAHGHEHEHEHGDSRGHAADRGRGARGEHGPDAARDRGPAGPRRDPGVY